jgi:hypothetical protein
LSPRNVNDVAAASGDAVDSGAIPFELHPSYLNPDGDDDDEEEEGDDAKKSKKCDERNFEVSEETASKLEAEAEEAKSASSGRQVTLYLSPGSYNCEKVLIYLRERGIAFEVREINLKNNQQVPTYMTSNSVPSMYIGIMNET